MQSLIRRRKMKLRWLPGACRSERDRYSPRQQSSRRYIGAIAPGADSRTPLSLPKSSGGKHSISRASVAALFRSSTMRNQNRRSHGGIVSALMLQRLVRDCRKTARLKSWLFSTGLKLLIQDTDMGIIFIFTMRNGVKVMRASPSFIGWILEKEKM